MNVIGLREGEQKAVFRLVAAVLHLGNVRFADVGGKAKVENRDGNYSFQLSVWDPPTQACLHYSAGYCGQVAATGPRHH